MRGLSLLDYKDHQSICDQEPMSPIEQPLNCINSPQLQKVRRKQKQHLTPKEKQKEANSVVKVAKNFAPRDQKRHHAHVPKEVLRCANPVESHKDK